MTEELIGSYVDIDTGQPLDIWSGYDRTGIRRTRFVPAPTLARDAAAFAASHASAGTDAPPSPSRSSTPAVGAATPLAGSPARAPGGADGPNDVRIVCPWEDQP